MTETATPVAVPDGPTLDAVDRWVSYRVWHSRTPGAQVALGLAGTPFFSRAYGYADLGQQVPLRTDHLFRVASHSKTFTATLVLQLVEQGHVGLEDPLGRYLPELDPALGDVRLRELLEHTGGVLRDSRDADFWQHQRPFPDTDELLRLAVEGGLKATPGERFAYSNVGYSLLGLVVERVTGQGFAAAARERITEPLGLVDTTADYVPARAADYAAGHTGLDTATRRSRMDHVDTSAMDAATGFTSTAEDLVVFYGALALGDERLLSDRSKRLQQRRVSQADPERDEAGGYGWGTVVDDVAGTTWAGHSGGYPGHITKTLLDPASGLVISVLTNAADGPATPLARGIAQLLAEGRTRSAEGPPVSEDALRRTGRYAGQWGVTDIAALGGRLRALSPTDWSPLEGADVLAEESADHWRIVAGSGFGSVGEPVTFSGEGEQTVMRYGGLSLRAFPDPEARTD